MPAIWEPLPATVTKELRQWMVNVICRKPGQHMIVQGGLAATAEVFRAMVGALTRNEVDARLMSVETIMHALAEDEEIEAGVLFISDFAMSQEPRTEVVKRRVMGTLRQRINAGLPCVLYVSDATSVKDVYGPVVVEELQAHFGAEVLPK